MSELYIPPERFERDFITGRFLKGCVSHNKGQNGLSFKTFQGQKYKKSV